jgi:Domain of unknown function (DUF4032)
MSPDFFLSDLSLTTSNVMMILYVVPFYITTKYVTQQEFDIVTTQVTPKFQMGKDDKHRLKNLPWHIPLEEWPAHEVIPLTIRRGESRHPVIFVESEGSRYAIKETTPHMAEREIKNLREIENRGIPVLSAVGTVSVAAPPLLLDMHGPGGHPQYMSGDRGYTVTRLTPRVIPHSLLFRLPFSRRTKRRLLGAVAVLLVELHEHGVYWGDPSLANVLIRIDGRRILAIMADAETAELFPEPVSEGLRQQDIASFGESLIWQAEDLRRERDLPEEETLVDDKDFRYFERRYLGLRREHALVASSPSFNTLYQVNRFLEGLNRLGYTLLTTTGHTLKELEFVTALPGWYSRRIHELLGIKVPRIYARHFYNLILGHQALMSQQEGRDVSIEEAAQHWYTSYHLPTILLLRKHLTSNQDPMQAYFSIMQHKWKLSRKAGYEVPLDEAAADWAMQDAEKEKLGAVDPANIATWWRERKPVTEVLEPPLIESEKLKPLLSEAEQPLVHLPQAQLDEKLTGILEQQKLDDDHEPG